MPDLQDAATGSLQGTNQVTRGALQAPVMPPARRRSLRLGMRGTTAQPQVEPTRRAVSWQCWAITAVCTGLMALLLITRLYSGASVAGRLQWGSISGRLSDYPDVMGPPSRHVHGSPGPASPGPEASATPSATASSSSPASSTPSATASTSSPASSLYVRSALVPTSWRVVRSYPHDTAAFTQGLAWRGRNLIEGTGMRGKSVLRVQRLAGTGRTPIILGQVSLPINHFGEGICPWPPVHDELALSREGDDGALDGATVYQLTWRERVVHMWSASSLLPGGDPSAAHSTASFASTKGEGWGLTSNGVSLIESDGSEFLHVWEPLPGPGGAMVQIGRERVVHRVRSNLPQGIAVPTLGAEFDAPVININELEYAHGWVLGNIWYDPRVAIIHPGTGAVVWYLDFSPLLAANQGHGEDCLNGLAYSVRLDMDSTLSTGEAVIATEAWGGRLWLTGKYWSKLYEVELTGLTRAEELADWDGMPLGPLAAARERGLRVKGKHRKAKATTQV